MSVIFISYRRDDSQGFAGRLEDDLSECFGDEQVFRDREIPVGTDFAQHLEGTLGAAAVVLAVIGPNWLVREGKGDRVRFQLAGDGPLLKDYQAKGLPPNVQLLGRVDDEELDRLYRNCDAFVLPTRFEGMPTVVLEAMARAKPILVSDVGATAELVDPRNGYLLPPGDADALYDAVLSFTERGSEVHAKMGANSLERAEQRFSWPAVTQEFLALFRRVAQTSTS